MKQPLLAAALCSSFLLSTLCFAQENKPVEILRGPKRGPAKKSAATEAEPQSTSAKKADALKAQEQALNAREAELNAREGSLKQREEDVAKSDTESKAKAEAEKKEKAKREKALQDLAHQNQVEFGRAADALGGN